MRILMAARAFDKQAIDGPTCRSRTSRATAASPVVPQRWGSTASGCCTRVRWRPPTRSHSPRQEDYDHAELILDAYDYHLRRGVEPAAR